MTRVLASVRSVAEAEIALAAGADLIDLKEPRNGALGALPVAVIREVVAHVAGRRSVSATVGDLPMAPASFRRAIAAASDLGVDLVKVGLGQGCGLARCLDVLGEAAARGLHIVAVLFADSRPDLAVVSRLGELGLAGVMLDTADKRSGTLRDHLDEATLGRFVEDARSTGLMTGLAGSLRLPDVAPLAALAPDFLGFRGALCVDARTTALDPARVRAVCAAVRRHSLTSAATATAGAQRAAHSRVSSVPSTSVAKST